METTCCNCLIKHNLMLSVENLHNTLKKVFSELELQGQPPELYEPIRYSMSLGGKRMRPLLALLACDMFGGDVQKAMDAAVGIELFHNFTLLHDDIMDQAPLRRGKETVYKRWNANRAILSGDTMFALANCYMLRTPPSCLAQVLDIFNHTAIEVCEGQQLDMNFETRQRVSVEEYMEMIRLKTAVLLAASLGIGALTAGASSGDSHLLYECGISLGLAFQLTDDLLDVYGDESTFGKMTGGDIVANKKTYLYLRALEQASAEQRSSLLGLFAHAPENQAAKIQQVKGIFDDLNVRELTRQVIDSYFEQAMAQLKTIGLPEKNTNILRDYAASLMQREV
jgi:geranylgeranyl diphosphate synthase, type II